MKTLAMILGFALLAGAAEAGEFIKREVGVDANGQAIQGYVFQSGSSHRRRSPSSSQRFGPSCFYSPQVVIRSTPGSRVTTIRTGPPVLLIPTQRPLVRTQVVVPR